MHVLIFGAGGQLGRALSLRATRGHTVTACPHSLVDIADLRAVSSFVGRDKPEVIINAAAYTAVDQAENEEAVAFRCNAEGPRNCAQAASEAHARLIHISTDYVFDGKSSTPYTPTAHTNPLGVYGRTKRIGEIKVSKLLPMRSVILRTSRLYDATGRNFVRTMLRLMRRRSYVRAVADQIGTPTSTESLAHAVWALVENPHIVGVHHWTDAGLASWYDFAIAIAEDGAAAGLVPPNVAVEPIATHEYPTSARRPSYSVLDTSSLRSLAIRSVHWRKNLRAVLAEIKDV